MVCPQLVGSVDTPRVTSRRGSGGGSACKVVGSGSCRLQASDERVVDSLYRKALGGDTTAMIFWLKNRRPSEWRDVQNFDATLGHYLLSDHPLTPEQWIAERATVDA